MRERATMRAVTYERFGPPEVLELSEVRVPAAARGQALVRVAFAAVNPKDCLVRKGKFRLLSGRRFPRRTGYDFAGELLKAGPGLEEGMPVFGFLNGWRGGSLAEIIAVPITELARSPSRASPMEVAGLPLVGLTALQGLRDRAQLKAGQRVCINGASGGVGTVAIQIAKALGGHVTAVCSDRNADLCLELGADRVVDYTQEDIITAGERFDVFFDVFGNKPFPLGQRILERGGVQVGVVPSPAILWHMVLARLRGRRFALEVVRSNRQDLEQIARWVDGGELRPVVDSCVPLTQAPVAHARMESKRSRGKVVVDCRADR